MNEKSKIKDDKKRNIASKLNEVDAIKFGEFTLTSGKTSPYYLDLRIVPSYPELLDLITEECSRMISEEIGKDGIIAGVPTAGLPFASVLSQKLEMPLVYVRGNKKSHGREKAVEGVLSEDKAILADDLTTTGGSIAEAAETLRNVGTTVKDAVVVVDREEGAVKNLKEKGIDLHFYLKLSEIIEYLRSSSEMSREKYNLVKEYLDSRK